MEIVIPIVAFLPLYCHISMPPALYFVLVCTIVHLPPAGHVPATHHPIHLFLVIK